MRRGSKSGRRGPGLIGTAARTAVIAGTATATSKAVSGAMDNAAQEKQQQQMANAAAMDAQAQVADLQQQVAAMQAQQVSPAIPPPAAPAPVQAAAAVPDMMAQLQQLAQMKEAGLLTDAEFSAAKAKLLGIG